MGKRVREICKTKLSNRNLFKTIYQDENSLINYYIEVLNITPGEFKNLDDVVRKILITYHIHLQPGCKERLYLPREELGRGLISIEKRSEKMLLQLRDLLEQSKLINTRRAAILKVEEQSSSHLYLIRFFLQDRNVFYNEYGKCNHYRKTYKTVGHLTSKYNESFLMTIQ